MESTHELKNILQSAANLENIGENQYAATCIDPSLKGKYPDDASALAFNKVIQLACEYKVEDVSGLTRDLRFIVKQSGSTFNIGVQRMANNGKWYHDGWIEPAEKMNKPHRYLKRRIVSRFISIQSSTVPIGQTQLNGAMNSVRMVFLPQQYASRSYDQLLPYAENERASVGNTPLHEGIVSLDVPTSTNPFTVDDNVHTETSAQHDRDYLHIPQTLQYLSVTSREYRSDLPQTSKFFSETGLFCMDRTDTSSLSYDPLAADLNEIYGLYRFTLSSPMIQPEGSPAQYDLRIWMKSHDNGVTHDYHDHPFMEWEDDDGHGPEHRFPFSRSVTFRSYNDVEKIEIVQKLGTGLIGEQVVTIEKLRSSSIYDSTPTVVTTLTGMDAGQVISLQGLINVEAVPGPDLRVDVKPEDCIKDGNDIEAARNLRTILRHHYGYDFLSTIQRYNEIRRIVSSQGLCQRCVINKAFIGAILPMLGQAAEFGIKYGPAMLEASKKVAQAAAPMFHMLPRGRVVNRNKASMNTRNYAQICDVEKAIDSVKISEKDVQPEVKEQETTGIPQKRNFAMIGTMNQTGRRINAAERQEVHIRGEDAEVPNIPFETQLPIRASDPEFSGYRHFPAIETTTESLRAIRCRVHVSKQAFQTPMQGQETRLVLSDEKSILIYVKGLNDAFEPRYDAESLLLEKDKLSTTVNRVLQFAARFCIEKGDDIVYFLFEADNEVPIEDFSFSAALESMLLGMDPSIVCTGDSCPSLDYQVQYNMPQEMISLKLDAFEESQYYIKADTSTDTAITLPKNVKNIGLAFATLSGNMPKYFGCENPVPLLIQYPEAYPFSPYGIPKAHRAVVKELVYVERPAAKEKGQPMPKRPMTDEEKQQAKLKDPYLNALKGYSDGDPNQYSALRKTGFVPMTDDGKVDKFLLAVKEPKMGLTVRAINKALPYLKKYVQCNSLPKKHKKSFETAYNALREVTDTTSIDDFNAKERSAIQAYVAMGHPMSGLSLIWAAKQAQLVPFDSRQVTPIGHSGEYVLPQIQLLRNTFLDEPVFTRPLDTKLYECLNYVFQDEKLNDSFGPDKKEDANSRNKHNKPQPQKTQKVRDEMRYGRDDMRRTYKGDNMMTREHFAKKRGAETREGKKSLQKEHVPDFGDYGKGADSSDDYDSYL